MADSEGKQLTDSQFKKISTKVLNYLHLFAREIDPTISVITTQQIRAFKQDRLISTTDIKISSEIMQHSPGTALKHYSKGSQLEQNQQLTLFYERLNKRIITTNETLTSVSVLIGHCKSSNRPKPIVTNLNIIEPDCKQPEGCLFCQHYRLHADEQDIRKLASIRYMINESRYNAVSEEHFNRVYGSTLERIESLFDSLRNLSESINELVNKIIDDVDSNENLSTYWQNKLDMLSIIGVI
jgi:hypothetical protein